MRSAIALAFVLLAAACGGSNSLSPDCDPCPFDHATIDGSSVRCACASGSGTQTYLRTMETTTTCADARVAWADYAQATCH